MEENKTNENLINSFVEITSSSKEEATFFLESHRWDLDAAVSTFLDNDAAAEPTDPNPTGPQSAIPSACQSYSPDYSPSETSPSRSRSPSPASRAVSYPLRSRAASENRGADNPSGSRNTRSRQHAGNIRTFADLNRSPAGAADSDSDEDNEYYTGGEKSSLKWLCTPSLVRREEIYSEPPKPKTPFQGVGRTLGASGSGTASAGSGRQASSSAPVNTAPSRGLVVDPVAPSTSVQLRLADGTRLVSRFNNHHTVRDVRGFIDASRPGGSKVYQLRTMGFPPKLLTDLDETIEQAGIANSVVIQKF